MSNSAQTSAMDRISALLDENSFVEIGASVTKRNTDFNLQEKELPGDGVVTGYGVIDGSLVYVYSQDAKTLGGSIGEMHAKKIAAVYDMAMKMGAPVIGLVDCSGLRLEEATDALAGFGSIYQKQALASGVIPQITAVFGTCGGGSAVSAALTDFTFMEQENGKLFVNSPNAIAGNYEGKCDTAAAKFQAEAGNADFVIRGEGNRRQRGEHPQAQAKAQTQAQNALEDNVHMVPPVQQACFSVKSRKALRSGCAGLRAKSLVESGAGSGRGSGRRPSGRPAPLGPRRRSGGGDRRFFTVRSGGIRFEAYWFSMTSVSRVNL